jgi:hypothetical protein
MRAGLASGVVVVAAVGAAGLVLNAQAPASNDVLSRRVEALERKVKELEEMVIGITSDDSKPGGTSSRSGGAGAPVAVRSSRVQAPFEIIGKNGKPFVRIVEPSSSFSGGVYVYNADGKPAAVLGILGDNKSGRVAVYDGVTDANAYGQLYYNAEGSHLVLHKTGHKGAFSASSKGLTLSNIAGYAAVSLSAEMDGSGAISIGNAAGDSVVEMKALTSGVGAVVTGPQFGGAGGLKGLPWAIMGKKGK